MADMPSMADQADPVPIGVKHPQQSISGGGKKCPVCGGTMDATNGGHSCPQCGMTTKKGVCGECGREFA